MVIFTRREDIKSYIQEQKLKKLKIGFVPTMGALHKGHASLIKQSVKENDISIVSIFVNPKQFGVNEDLSKYPRQFQKDCNICEENGVSVVFSPTVEEIYPEGFSTQISLSRFSNFMCGKFRPGHFEGVATIVMILLNIIQPNSAYFGQKDFQQIQIIKQMSKDLACNHSIVTCPTIREDDGLAYSSRNVYLSEESRNTAKIIPQALANAAKLYLSGERSCEKMLSSIIQLLNTKNLSPQYLEIRSTKDFTKQIIGQIEEECSLAIAQFIQSGDMQVRLIDNIILSEDSNWNRVLKEFSVMPS